MLRPAGSSQSKPNESTEFSNLLGWASIEDYTKRHDKSFVEDLSDDINTLLVFAGLFSAVLTAFTAVSFTLLQPDSAQSVIERLDRISGQLDSFTISPGYANSTMRSPSPTSTFTPPASARWINCLWFLSLVFSLAAALFGILAKQWLREYMQWDYALSTPRENVLARQIRFEAWNKWNVPAAISFIPALLELALVLFLAGLLVFLWDIDWVVAVVATLAVGIFLAITIVLTVTPAFWKRCPYKSPTSWAFLVLWETMGRFTLLGMQFLRVLSRLILAGIRKEAPPLARKTSSSSRRSWRERDVAYNRTYDSLGRGIRRSARKAIPDAFKQVQMEASSNSPQNILTELVFEEATPDRAPWYSILPPRPTPTFLSSTMPSICDSATLFRALSWVSKASPSPAVLRQVSESAKSLFEGDEDNKRLLITWCLLEQQRSLPSTYSTRFHGTEFVIRTRHQLVKKYGAVQECYSIFRLRDPPNVEHLGGSTTQRVHKRELVIEARWDDANLPIILGNIVQTIISLLRNIKIHASHSSRVLATQYSLDPESNVEITTWSSPYAPARRMVELLCLFHHIYSTSRAMRPSDILPLVEVLVDEYNTTYQQPAQVKSLDETYPGLRTVFFQILRVFHSLRLDNHGTKIEIVDVEVDNVRQRDLTDELVRTVDEAPSEGRGEYLHMAATIVGGAFVKLNCANTTIPASLEDGPFACTCLTKLVMCCIQDRIRDFGYHTGYIRWLETTKKVDISPFYMLQSQRKTTRPLLRALHRYLCEGLASDYDRLRKVVHIYYVPGDAYLPDNSLEPHLPNPSLLQPQKQDFGEARKLYVWRLDDWFRSLSVREMNPSDIRSMIREITSVAASPDSRLGQSSNIIFGPTICFPWYDALQAGYGKARKVVRRHAREEFEELIAILMKLDEDEARRTGWSSKDARLELEELAKDFSALDADDEDKDSDDESDGTEDDSQDISHDKNLKNPENDKNLEDPENDWHEGVDKALGDGVASLETAMGLKTWTDPTLLQNHRLEWDRRLEKHIHMRIPRNPSNSPLLDVDPIPQTPMQTFPGAGPPVLSAGSARPVKSILVRPALVARSSTDRRIKQVKWEEPASEQTDENSSEEEEEGDGPSGGGITDTGNATGARARGRFFLI